MKKGLAVCCLLIAASSLFAQADRDEKLAKSYFESGEYDKATELFQTLWAKSNNSPTYYLPLYKCLFTLKKFDDLEKVVKKQVKRFDNNPQFYVDLGYLYTAEGNESKAKEQYEKALKIIPPNESAIRTLANIFEAYQLNNYVLLTYQKGGKELKNPTFFSYEMAKAYTAQSDYANAVKLYLENLETHPENVQQIKNTLQSAKDAAKLMNELETQLYAKVQHVPDGEIYIDLLTWIYIQNKDFEGAIQQMKALDKRRKENGMRVLNIARMAQTEGYYADAINGYDYVVGKGKSEPLYVSARTELLNCRKEKISKTINYTTGDILALRDDYIGFITETGKNSQSAEPLKELADLEGFYLHNIDTAILICEDLVKIQNIPPALKNQTKLSLGDFYLISGDVWESTLLYSQVDKEEKDGPLGEEARFRNAKLAYYRGEFELAQTQLEVLKASTSELISNDAINLSVFIIDNLGLDTIATPMQLFARAELLLFQNKDDEATVVLDSIKRTYPNHALSDDIEYAEAKLMVKKRNFEKAKALLGDILKNYKTDLLGDDATFMLADIYEKEFKDKAKAMELFKSIITDYNSSLLVIEARKRYRMLRGDGIN